LVIHSAILSFPTRAFGQTENLMLKGFVLDATTKQPVTGVHIVDLDKATGTISDSVGSFSFPISGFPARIGFRHISYFPDSLIIKTKQEFINHFSKAQQVIFLRTNVFLINEVTVSSGAARLFDKEPYAIIDYQVSGHKIIALGLRNYNEFKKEILIADLNGKIKTSQSRPRIREIYKDCLGEVYLVDDDSAFQIHIKNNRIICEGSCPIRFFTDFIRHIDAVTETSTVVSAASQFKQFNEYYLISEPANETKRLYSVGNRVKEEKEQINQYISKECRKTILNSFMTALQVKETNDRLFTFELGNRYEGMVANKPVYSTLYQVDDSLLLFDFSTYSIVKFTLDGKIAGEIPMHIVFNDDWENRMHRDPVTGRFYLEFLNGQSTYLIEIDPGTGKEVRKIPIRNYKHIDHVSVNNNRVFFLYQPDFGDRGKKLYYYDI
jgi:hypothetical protein